MPCSSSSNDPKYGFRMSNDRLDTRYISQVGSQWSWMTYASEGCNVGGNLTLRALSAPPYIHI